MIERLYNEERYKGMAMKPINEVDVESEITDDDEDDDEEEEK